MSRFSIRPFTIGDIDEVFVSSCESFGHVSPWMGWLTPAYTRKDAEHWVNHAISDWGNTSYEHLIIDTQTGRIAGACGLNSVDPINRFANLGYWVRAGSLHQGAAKSATLLLRDFGFETVGLNRLEIVVATGNLPSQKVARSVGAHYEGIQRKRLCVGEISHDAHMFALIRES